MRFRGAEAMKTWTPGELAELERFADETEQDVYNRLAKSTWNTTLEKCRQDMNVVEALRQFCAQKRRK
jgi:hypothetical protein